MAELYTTFLRIIFVGVTENALRQVTFIFILMTFRQTLEDGMVVGHLVQISHTEMLYSISSLGNEEHGYTSPTDLTLLQQPLNTLPVFGFFITFSFLIDEFKVLEVFSTY